MDADLQKSAECLTDAALCKTIEGCFSAAVTTILHFAGIRGKKAYEYMFDKDRRDQTMEKFFPGWPFRAFPRLKYCTNRIVKWTYACREHFDYVLAYFCALETEYEARFGKKHKLADFSEWVQSEMRVAIPSAGIFKIILPWKALKTKFRRKDIVEGYRLQYADSFLCGDPVMAYASSHCDIPDFVVKRFNLETRSFIT